MIWFFLVNVSFEKRESWKNWFGRCLFLLAHIHPVCMHQVTCRLAHQHRTALEEIQSEICKSQFSTYNYHIISHRTVQTALCYVSFLLFHVIYVHKLHFAAIWVSNFLAIQLVCRSKKFNQSFSSSRSIEWFFVAHFASNKFRCGFSHFHRILFPLLLLEYHKLN